MRAIIISDADSANLLDQLKLASLTAKHNSLLDQPPSVEGIHRIFHYVVCRWLQEQGANVVR